MKVYVVSMSLYSRHTGNTIFGIIGVYKSLEKAWDAIEYTLNHETSTDIHESRDVVKVDVNVDSCSVDLTYTKLHTNVMYYQKWQITPMLVF